jgi:hypothetical protein
VCATFLCPSYPLNKLVMKTFDWDEAATRHSPQWIAWLKENHNKPVTLEEYLNARAEIRKTDTRPHLADIYSVAKSRHSYINLKTKFGFFNAR